LSANADQILAQEANVRRDLNWCGAAFRANRVVFAGCFVYPNPDEPESNRRMMSSQKTEVGHILKSKNAVAFLLFEPSGTSPRTWVPII
jgi:hypothetical protein